MKDTICTVKKILTGNMAALLLFELSFRVLLKILSGETQERVLDRILKMQGYSYMTEDNYGRVLSHPLTVLTAVLALLLFLLLLLFECCGLLACFERGWRKEKITMPGILRAGAAGALRVIRRHPLKWIPCMALGAPINFRGGIWNGNPSEILRQPAQSPDDSGSRRTSAVFRGRSLCSSRAASAAGFSF